MHFELKKSQDKQYYWILVGDNGKTLATSEMYQQKQSAKDTIDSIGEAFQNACDSGKKIEMKDKTGITLVGRKIQIRKSDDKAK